MVTNFGELIERLDMKRIEHCKQAGAHMVVGDGDTLDTIAARQMSYIARLDALNDVIDEVTEMYEGPDLNKQDARDSEE
jgi:hypothetical protein